MHALQRGRRVIRCARPHPDVELALQEDDSYTGDHDEEDGEQARCTCVLGVPVSLMKER